MSRQPDPAPAGPPVPFVLDGELSEFLRGGVSIGVGTRDAALRPHAVRAVGARHDGARVIVYVPSGQAAAVLDDVEANGRVAVVFTRPSTHRTYQLKGRDARRVPVGPEDRAAVRAYRDAFALDLDAVGFPPAYTDALLEGLDGELAGVAFTPEAGFVGTPGPGAGDPLRGER